MILTLNDKFSKLEIPSNPCARYHLCGSDLLTLESVEYNEMRRPQSKIHEQRCPQIALLRLP